MCSCRCRGPTRRWPTGSAAIAAASRARWQAAGWIAAAGLPLTLNFVMHRQNMHQLDEAIALAERPRGAAARGRDRAVPRLGDGEPRGADADARAGAGGGRDGAGGARAAARAARHRLRAGRLPRALSEALHGRLGVDRDQRQPRGAGAALPRGRDDPGAGLRDGAATGRWRRSGRTGRRSRRSAATDWMQEPCRSCERRDIDFGGCRCQAMALAGDARGDRSGLREVAAAMRELAALAEGFASRRRDALVWRRFPAGREAAVERSGAQPAI